MIILKKIAIMIFIVHISLDTKQLPCNYQIEHKNPGPASIIAIEPLLEIDPKYRKMEIRHIFLLKLYSIFED